MKHKFLIIIMILALVLSLAGCGAAEASATEKSAENITKAAAPEEAGEAEEIPAEDPPTLPEGEAPDGAPGDLPQGEPPERPEGDDGRGAPPDGEPGGGGKGAPPDGKPGGGFGGGSSGSVEYTAATEITGADKRSGETYESSASDESALLIATSEDVTIEDPTVLKTGDSDGGDNCNFYGLNAAVLVKDGATVTITGGEIVSDADGANGVFSYGGNGGKNGAAGDGTTVIISDAVIRSRCPMPKGIRKRRFPRRSA